MVTRGDGAWIACEVKLGSTSETLDQAAATLNRFAGRIDTKRSGTPAALVVLTGGGYGYVREDGVHVVPLTALGP